MLENLEIKEKCKILLMFGILGILFNIARKFREFITGNYPYPLTLIDLSISILSGFMGGIFGAILSFVIFKNKERLLIISVILGCFIGAALLDAIALGLLYRFLK